MRGRVVLLTVSAGAGHDAVCGVLKEEWESRGTECQVIDLFTCLPGSLKRFAPDLYLKMVRFTPFMWRAIYRRTDSPYKTLSPLLAPLWNEAVRRLKKAAPSMIIATHPLATAVADLSIRKCAFPEKPALFSLVTDYSFHGMSLSREVTAVFLPDLDEVLRQQQAFPFARFVHGCISIRSTWEAPVRREELRRRMSLPVHAKVAAVSGGKEGLIPYKEVVRSFEKDTSGTWTLLCFTGENTRAARQLEALSTRHDVRVFPYTHTFADFVKAADVLISKPGGVTMTEALAARIPVIITSPLPGQEEENAKRLKKHAFIRESPAGETGRTAEQVLKDGIVLEDQVFISTKEMIDDMIRLKDEMQEKTRYAAPEKGRILRMNHILAMRAKKEEEKQFRS
ncbi:MGDG synthase family glycosyltransferase [Alteribacter lacisalsi]|uniref:MGDG synthase family glycosyltransferase n=1 Tax=Alteribacter lacisalsi TaxID=2045244 RepID=UPI001374B751|nr:glycosyltransferase [Alteribacter lacisalsi]